MVAGCVLRALEPWEQGTDMARHRKIPLSAEWRVDHRRRPGWGSQGGGRDAQKAENMDIERERKEGRRHPG